MSPRLASAAQWAHSVDPEDVAEGRVVIGVGNVLVAYEPQRDRIRVEYRVAADAESAMLILGENPGAALADRAQQRLARERMEGFSARGARALVFEPEDFEVVLSRGDAPILEFQASRGGNWLADSNVLECTSGWSVQDDATGAKGIVTAGHCSGLDRFYPFNMVHYSMSWKRQVSSSQGDAEFHTTSKTELPEFYAANSTVRDVDATKSTSQMVGGSVCTYGHASNSRSCDHVVTHVNSSVILPNGTVVSKIAATDNLATIEGDSGGGLSWGGHGMGRARGHGPDQHSHLLHAHPPSRVSRGGQRDDLALNAVSSAPRRCDAGGISARTREELHVKATAVTENPRV